MSELQIVHVAQGALKLELRTAIESLAALSKALDTL
jgi:hypothetical protein